jgi:HEAT repeat protein
MRRLSLWILFLAIAGSAILVLLFPSIALIGLGRVRGEAFFEGRPTDYWARALNGEAFLGQAAPAGDFGQTLRAGGAAAVPVVCELIERPEPKLRLQGLSVLALMGAEAASATPALAKVLQTEGETACFILAAKTLAKLNPGLATTELSAIVGNKADQGDRRSWALVGLQELAPNCSAAAPILDELARDRNEDVLLRVAAIAVLTRLGRPSEALVTILCDTALTEQTPAGVQALQILGEMGPAARSAVPALIKLLERPNLPMAGLPFGPPHRQAVVESLGMIGPDASPALPALLATLQISNLLVRTEVALALARIGPAAKRAVASRDALWGSSIVLLGAVRSSYLATPPLVERARKLWVPADVKTRKGIHDAIALIDPVSAGERQAGLKGF